MAKGVVVNFDFGERFPGPRSQQRGSLRPRARRVAVLGVGAGGGRPLPLMGSGVSPPEMVEIFDAKSRVWRQSGPENTLIAGQPDEYDVIWQCEWKRHTVCAREPHRFLLVDAWIG